ncbi:hypothetical protein [Luteipulveratus mongoliensis]|uniref:Uncharacterized protein n=1 Tax=Luteipulveratus mongoliensis TaxID=571913 RepID=A0A0K1JJ18_9MICO|nr:hypothetical protein [Luteipulveratus mongoliensis]AKU16590.1 hypothetical protein VV02_13180 [Luteipulveratus mongoliensis]
MATKSKTEQHIDAVRKADADLAGHNAKAEAIEQDARRRAHDLRRAHDDAAVAVEEIKSAFLSGDDSHSAADFTQAKSELDRWSLLAQGHESRASAYVKRRKCTDRDVAEQIADALAKVYDGKVATVGTAASTSAPETAALPLIVVQQTAPTAVHFNPLGLEVAGLAETSIEVRYHRSPLFAALSIDAIAEPLADAGVFPKTAGQGWVPVSVSTSGDSNGNVVDSVSLSVVAEPTMPTIREIDLDAIKREGMSVAIGNALIDAKVTRRTGSVDEGAKIVSETFDGDQRTAVVKVWCEMHYRSAQPDYGNSSGNVSVEYLRRANNGSLKEYPGGLGALAADAALRMPGMFVAGGGRIAAAKQAGVKGGPPSHSYGHKMAFEMTLVSRTK